MIALFGACCDLAANSRQTLSIGEFCGGNKPVSDTGYWALMPACFTTRPHFAISLSM